MVASIYPHKVNVEEIINYLNLSEGPLKVSRFPLLSKPILSLKSIRENIRIR